MHVRVHGRVQGVFFRDTTRRRARQHDVAGWVRNCPDGTVEAYLEGEREAVEAILDWIRHGGPRAARVERVEAREVPPEGHTGFAVR